MHDIKIIRKKPDFFLKKITERNVKFDIKNLLDLDKKNRDLIQKKEKFEQEKKLISKKKEEKLNNMTKPEKICQNLAKQKSIKTSLKYPSYLVLGVDTCLIYKKKFLSKPKTKTMATQLLNKLKGKEHKIYSSLYISKKGKKIWSCNDEAKLKIRKLTKKEITRYMYKFLNGLIMEARGIKDFLQLTQISLVLKSFFSG